MSLDLDAQLALFRARHCLQRRYLAGSTWSYIAAGSGPATLLLLPGAPGIAEMAFPYISAFERRYRVIAPSYPAAVAARDQLLAGIEQLIAAEAAGPFHLIGASYSGLVAQHLIARRRCRVASLLIGDTGVPRPARAIALRLARAALACTPRLALQAAFALLLWRMLAGDTAARRFWRRYFKGVIVRLTPAELANRVQVMIEMDRLDCQNRSDARWTGPTLLIETVDDPLFSAAERAALRARYPQAQIHRFYSRDHTAAITHAPDYIAVMEAFLDRLDCS